MMGDKQDDDSDLDTVTATSPLKLKDDMDDHPVHLSEEELQESNDSDTDDTGLLDLECQMASGLDLSTRQKRGIRKYKHALKSLKPYRNSKAPKDELPESTAGFFSLLTYAWLTPIMWKIYKKGTGFLSNMRCSDINRAEINSERLEKLWKEELKRKGPKDASFGWVIFRAVRTRVFFGGFTIILSVSFSFFAPAIVLKKLLNLLSDKEEFDVGYGVLLVAIISVMEFSRTMLFALGWIINYTTGIRLRAATLSLIYKKILKLRSLKDKSVGELVNLCSNDGQRLFEAAAIGPLLFGGPVVLLYGIVYTVFLIGPWALVGSATYLMFYPFMAVISRLTAYYRRTGIKITDSRVRMMSELLTYIKLIKMYAWEVPFTNKISGIRSNERNILEKAALVQGFSTSSAPLVPVMASVFVILAHVLTGNDLTAAQAFTLVAVLNSMRFSLGVIPYAVRAIAESLVSFKRCQSVLLMEDIKPHVSQITNPNHVIVLKNATFGWDASSLTEGSNKKVQIANGKSKLNKAEEKQRLQDGEEVADSDPDVLQTLIDLNFVLEKGKLIGVCGSVGCGKSSLISAVMGRMVLLSGKVATKGSVAYVSQQAWIMNSTARENILFGQVYDEEKYKAVVQACSLEEDFKDFVDGDMTEIGERGINMSGGQKQRVSLARAVYADKDVYLLDDPLSAVDIHVGRHIFSECLVKCLKGKTILFVTHQLQYLKHCDGIIVMSDGKITESGKHDELTKNNGEYANLISTYYSKGESDSEEEEEQEFRERLGSSPKSPRERTFSGTRQRNSSGRERTLSSSSNHSHRAKGSAVDRQISTMSAMSDASGKQPVQNAGKLMVAEERAKGKVTAQTYWNYIQSAGGVFVTGFVLLTYLLSVGVQSGTSWWLSYWLNQGSGNTTVQVTIGNMTVNRTSTNIRHNPDINFYAMIYGLGIAVVIVITIFRTLLFMKVTLHASSKMHDTIFRKILSCPMQFFDTTPVGRIINRFSSDMDEIDIRLPGSAEVFLMNILTIIFALVSICYVSLWFLIALVPLVACFVLLNVIFTSGVRELKRLDSTTRSPLLSHVTASIQGISTIHAFGKSQEFLNRFHQLMDTNTLPFFLFYSSNRWLAVRLDLLSAIVIGITGLLVILTYESMTPALAGMAMAFAIQLTGLFQFTIRLAIETEARFVSVERLQHYSKEEASEAPAIIKNNRPESSWPKDGAITFKSVKMRYRENLPYALKGVSFDVLPQEKIGIVGRSGSGKSSLGVALFRLVELNSGSILIDKMDISKIGLEDLRSKLAIIPQDPVLFVGTIRYNLDPFQQYTDPQLWEALEKCHIKETIVSLEQQLDSPVVENGENFSVGERQLMCLARALLRHSKILMLDEATAAIDTETDALVQTTIKEAFADCTMLIIAHRLNTVLNCNRILVMEDGKMVEFNSPAVLVANPKSKFKMMLDATEGDHDHR
ncbi:LOW QUALITY PROTEIN: multidrug resistance-associated protein 5-like [Pecten maximus]|uniref:LOW QUALITY PROTEIN: multidrug resistance-associated protein 5-like n=1 Tax=Pecten maximus TaxID=6579 RepID=UPI0014582499|nr:LOW QUALITY PROTEIN: multidrug resistance-associated protein 5-like [Pecten maximus]